MTYLVCSQNMNWSYISEKEQRNIIIHFKDGGMSFYFINSTFNICNGKYICISLVCTKIWRNMRCNGKVCFCLQGGGNSSDGNWQSQPKSMGNRSLCENCLILQHCVVLKTRTERERKLQKMSAYNFAVDTGTIGFDDWIVVVESAWYIWIGNCPRCMRVLWRNINLQTQICTIWYVMVSHYMVCSGRVW